MPFLQASGRETTGSYCSRRRKAREERLVQESNEVIEALNEIYQSQARPPSSAKPSLAQSKGQHAVYYQLARLRRPQSPCKLREAIQELLHTSLSYDGEMASSTVRSYDRALISLPDCASSPVPLEQVLDESGRDTVKDPFRCMMLSEEEWGEVIEQHSPIEPYMDPLLKDDLPEYSLFIQDLFHKNMVDFTEAPRDCVTPFFVAKKSGRLRMVLDCRTVNRRFRPPPPLALSAGYSWSRLRVPKGKKLYIAQSDIRDYFYALEMPHNLRPLFCLPPVPKKLLREWDVPADRGGDLVGDNGWVWPMLRVIPMGWSWAMWLAQKVHEEQVRIATGFGPERILTEGSSAPSLDGNIPVLIPYADNLNVCGLCRSEVQKAKEQVVSHLQALGFRTHEEIDAGTRAISLGFLVDGDAGLVTPIPEKLDKICQVFQWLSTRPRVAGKSVERLLGHAVHVAMLRRELLSIFRCLYDFVHHSYSQRKRLWASAAREARWAARLLKLCCADLTRQWDGEITCSDASLSGVAVCKRSLSPELIGELGSQREVWRYKSFNPTLRPRDKALGFGDPFTDPATVKPCHHEVDLPFTLNREFKEIPKQVMDTNSWSLSVAAHMTIPEHITLLEGRGFVASLRHKLRAARSFGKSHLHLGDNLGMVLAAEKGRSGSYGLLQVCRRLAALTLCSNSQVCYRWVPSEWNVADAGSRRWEALRVNHAEGRSVRSKAKEVRAKIDANRSLFGEPGAGSAPSQGTGISSKERQATFGRRESSREDFQEGSIHSGSHATASLSRTVSAGAGSGDPSSGARLPEEVHGVRGICEEAATTPSWSEEVGRGLSVLSQQRLRARLRPVRSQQVLRRGPRRAPRLWPQGHPPSLQKVLERLASARSGQDTTAAPLGTGSPHRNRHVASKSSSSGRAGAVDVHHVHAAWGGSQREKGGPYPSQPQLQALQPQPLSRFQARALKDGLSRREHSPRLSPSSLARRCSSSAGSKKRLCLAGGDGNTTQRPVGSHTTADRSSWKPLRAVPTSALGAESRPSDKSQEHVGSQDEREVGGGFVGQKVRGSRSSGSRVPSSPKESAAESPSGSRQLRPGGPKVFWCKDSLAPWVVGIFSGSARLSRTAAQHGFNAIAFDIAYGHNCDVLRQSVQSSIQRFLRMHTIALLWFGVPSESWSRARRWDGGSTPLREDVCVYGRSGLSGADIQKVEAGNQLVRVTYQLCKFAIDQGISWVIENPYTSRMWLTQEVHELRALGATLLRVDLCAYRVPWRKATGLLSHAFVGLDRVLCCCRTKHGRCEFSGRRHIVLTGKNADGMWLTRIAQPYPVRLCHAICGQLASSHNVG